MSERPSSSLRTHRKHFVKCVDCRRQMLPQNAPKEQRWTAAASLCINGGVNDGALCFYCANKRREALGLAAEKEQGESSPPPVCKPTLKRVRINAREYSWKVSTLESLLIKWRDESLSWSFKDREIRSWLVAINDEIIPARRFSSIPIFDGDTVFIAMGAIAGG